MIWWWIGCGGGVGKIICNLLLNDNGIPWDWDVGGLALGEDGEFIWKCWVWDPLGHLNGAVSLAASCFQTLKYRCGQEMQVLKLIACWW